MRRPLYNAIRAVNRTVAYCGSVGAVALMGAAPVALAQDQIMEEVVVTGIRGALSNALDIKRNSVAGVDAVSAEDIGKFPDNNVAEALMRVPGVSVSRQFGEGDTVSIRGASNQMTLTTLNGQSVASTGWYSQQAIDRSFNYSMLPSELVAGLEVYKTSQADLVEGGVGGTVNVKTRKPLDLDANAVFLSVEGVYSSGSGDVDPNISGLYSFKNYDETFGFLIAAARSDYSYVRRGDEGLPSWGGRIAANHFDQKRERTAINATAQFAPTDEIDMGLNYMSLELVADGVNTAAWVPQDLDNCQFNAQGAPILCENVNDNAGQTFWDVRPRLATMDSETFDAWFTYTNDLLKAEFRLGNTKATGGTNYETNVAYLETTANTNGVIDSRGKQVRWNLVDPNFTPDDLPSAGNYAGWEGLQTGAVISSPNIDEETYFQTDLTFEVDAGPISSIKTGLRWTDHDVKTTQYRGVFDGYDGEDEADLVDASVFTNGTLKAGMDNWIIPAPNADAMLAYTRANLTGWTEDRSSYATINEENISLYVMANIEAEGLRGNFGVRYISTDVKGDYYFLDDTGAYDTTLSTAEGSYSDVLPSLNLAIDLADDVILRFSAAKVMTRANYQDMFPSASLSGLQDNVPGNETVTRGNIGLLPYTANQADLGVEWYFAADSLLSLTYFRKDVTSFTTSGIIQDQSIGIVSPDTNEDNWTVETLVNGSGGTIDGLEFQLQHAMDNGFGGVFNYTFAEVDADASNFADGNGVLSDSSRHNFNLVGYYENDMFAARAAYNWRSEYMIREIGFYSNREHQSYGTLDLNFSWYLSDNVTLTFDALNVLKEDSIQVGRDQGDATFWRTSDGYPAYSYAGEARYSLGVKFQL